MGLYERLIGVDESTGPKIPIQPFAAVFAEYARARLTGAEAQDIIAQSDRLEAWVRELLAYTQPLDASATPVALEPLVQRCLADFAPDFQQRGVQASVDVAPGLPPVRGDAMLLTRSPHAAI